jgi:putative CocE/NonD family hydrolase
MAIMSNQNCLKLLLKLYGDKMKIVKYVLPLILTFLIGLHAGDIIDELTVVIKKDVMIPMRDGVELSANISRPDDTNKYPVILMRTPYGKDNEEDEFGEYIARMGYVLVVQDCRGTSKSNGVWIPGINEKNDGIDTRRWILKQSWCNGQIGTYGASYLGFTQFASSTEDNNSLKVMVAGVPVIDWYNNTTYIGGALNHVSIMGWCADMADPKQGEGSKIEGELDFKALPLIEWDKNNVGVELPWMREWIKNPVDNRFWKSISDMNEIKEKLDIPLLITSGWYDLFSIHALDYIADAIRKGKNDQHLIMGPQGHGESTLPGGIDLDESIFEEMEQYDFAMLNYWLKDFENEKPELAPIKLFVMGENYWRDEYEWPLKRTKYVNYFLSSNGNANTLNGDGRLSADLTSKTKNDKYIYDPNDPVPTKGGAVLYGKIGPYDHTEIELRNDVLVYTTPALDTDLEVTGNVKVVLYASTDVTNTDWTAKLLDVYPDGKAYNLCDGIIRASYNEDPKNPGPIEPKKIYKYDIDLWATSNVFQKGHKIRVEISSSNFPRFDRNPNTGNVFGMDAELKIANQTIYHGREYPSHIILPVTPNK